jgi:hypothetical protein
MYAVPLPPATSQNVCHFPRQRTVSGWIYVCVHQGSLSSILRLRVSIGRSWYALQWSSTWKADLRLLAAFPLTDPRLAGYRAFTLTDPRLAGCIQLSP